jgi:hypothetical protein
MGDPVIIDIFLYAFWVFEKRERKLQLTLPTKTFRPITTTMEFECQVQAVGDGLQCRLKSHLVAKKIIVKKVFFFFL